MRALLRKEILLLPPHLLGDVTCANPIITNDLPSVEQEDTGRNLDENGEGNATNGAVENPGTISNADPHAADGARSSADLPWGRTRPYQDSTRGGGESSPTVSPRPQGAVPPAPNLEALGVPPDQVLSPERTPPAGGGFSAASS